MLLYRCSGFNPLLNLMAYGRYLWVTPTGASKVTWRFNQSILVACFHPTQLPFEASIPRGFENNSSSPIFEANTPWCQICFWFKIMTSISKLDIRVGEGGFDVNYGDAKMLPKTSKKFCISNLKPWVGDALRLHFFTPLFPISRLTSWLCIIALAMSMVASFSCWLRCVGS